MRSIILFVLSLCPLFNFLIGQESDSLSYILDGRFHSNEILLRWTPSSYETWKEGNLRGYKIYRSKIVGEDLVGFDKVYSGLLDTNDINNANIPDSLKRLCIAVVSNTPVPLEFNSSYDAINMYNASKSITNNYFSTLVLTNKSFPLATLMTLGASDNYSLSRGKTYRYFLYYGDVDLDVDRNKYLATLNIEASNYVVTEIDSIKNLRATGYDGNIHLTWQPHEFTKYVTYRVLRGDQSTPMSLIGSGDSPILDFRDNPDDEMGYLDTGLIVGAEYRYSIRGFDVFGIEGPKMEIINYTSYPSPLSVYPLFDSITVIPYQKYTIRWNFPEDYVAKVAYFKIFRSRNTDTNWEEIANVSTSGAGYEYDDINPPKTAYYRIVAYQTYTFNELPSIERLVQMPDTIPPGKPTIIQALGRKENNVVLNWHPPQDDDVDGYKVYLANSINGNYLEISTDLAKDSIYQFAYNMNTLREKIFLKVRAVDYHDNYSALSDPVEVLLPDIVAPAAPVLVSAIPSYSGVSISFYRSASDDVVIHKLMRRKNGEMNWVLVGQMDSIDTQDRSFVYNFVDTTITSEAKYTYRLWAYDEVNNGASSLPLTLKATPSPVRNVHFRLKYFETNDTINGVEQKLLIIGIINTSDMSFEGGGYQIYRSVDNGPLEDHDYITHIQALTLGSLYFDNSNLPTYRDIIIRPRITTTSNTPGIPPQNPNTAFTSVMYDHLRLKYYVRIVFSDGTVSQLSEPIYVDLNF